MEPTIGLEPMTGSWRIDDQKEPLIEIDFERWQHLAWGGYWVYDCAF